MKLVFDNIQLRDIKDTDVNSIVKYANNYSVSKFLRDSFPFPYTKENANQWINFLNNDNFNLHLPLQMR